MEHRDRFINQVSLFEQFGNAAGTEAIANANPKIKELWKQCFAETNENERTVSNDEIAKLSKAARNKFLACLFIRKLDGAHDKLKEDLNNSFALGNEDACPTSINACIDLINGHKDNSTVKQDKKLFEQEEQCNTTGDMVFANNGNNKSDNKDFACCTCGNKGHVSRDCTKIINFNDWWMHKNKDRVTFAQATQAAEECHESTGNIPVAQVKTEATSNANVKSQDSSWKERK